MQYQFKKTEATAEKLKQYSELLSLVFKSTDKFSQDFLHWQYVQNPEGPVLGFDAYYDQKLVAHYVTLPVSYLVNGQKTKGLLSLNTSVHPDHQGKKLFTRLAMMTFEQAQKLGYNFVIGVANQNSTHGFLKKLGFYLIAPLEAKIGLKKIKIKKNQEYKLIPHWTLDKYKWRLSNPSGLYFKKGNQIFTPSNKYGIYAQMASINRKLTADFELKKTVANIKVWIGLAKKEKGYYLPIPSLLKPSPLNLIFKDLTGNFPIFSSKDVLFELIDFDAY